jgi:hypothetical protein
VRSLVERIREPRIAAVIGVVVAAVIILILVIGGGDDNGGSSSTAEARGPEVVTVDDLQDLPNSVGHPVYWAGDRAGIRYELTVQADGNIFLRYLAPDEQVGADVPTFTVGTYPVPDAHAALESVANRPGALRSNTPDGALVVTNKANPQSVYIAYPGSDYQIEVYDPDAATALQTATSGEITPIE